jgi:hypothetical protein
MKWHKAVWKGVEAGLPASIAAFSVSGESRLVMAVTFAAGFGFGFLKNWFKHRGWK